MGAPDKDMAYLAVSTMGTGKHNSCVITSLFIAVVEMLTLGLIS
jgi:hypothetical protein